MGNINIFQGFKGGRLLEDAPHEIQDRTQFTLYVSYFNRDSLRLQKFPILKVFYSYTYDIKGSDVHLRQRPRWFGYFPKLGEMAAYVRIVKLPASVKLNRFLTSYKYYSQYSTSTSPSGRNPTLISTLKKSSMIYSSYALT